MPTGCNYAFWGVAFCFNSRNFYYLVLFQLRKQIQAHDCYFNMDTDTLQIWVLGTLHLRVLVVGFFNQHRQHISYQQKKLYLQAIFMLCKEKLPSGPHHQANTHHILLRYMKEVLLKILMTVKCCYTGSSDNSQLCRKLPKDMFSLESHLQFAAITLFSCWASKQVQGSMLY